MLTARLQLDLRLRLVARTPVLRDDLRVTAAGRRLLIAELAKPDMTEVVTALATNRVEVPAGLRWRPKDDHYARNDSRGASYDCVIKTAADRPAIRGTQQYVMPHLMVPDISAVVDVEFDVDGCQVERRRSEATVVRRLSLSEIVDFFTRAWLIAFDVLPLALGGPQGLGIVALQAV